MKLFHYTFALLAVPIIFACNIHAAMDVNAINNVLKQFAPAIQFHKDEKYLPSSVEWYVNRSSLEQRNPNAVLKQKGSVTAPELGNYNNPPAGAEYYLNPQGDQTTYAGQPLVNGAVSNEVPIYVSFVETPKGGIATYWDFAPYNGPFQGPASVVSSLIEIGIHEGDWEHVKVFLIREGSNWKIDKVYFARHSPSVDGGYVAVKDLEFVDGHFKVYKSLAGHASHAHDIKIVDPKNFDLTSGSGPLWRTWNNLIYVGTVENPTPGQDWLKFKGRWGSTSNSPQTPPLQRSWRSVADQKIPLLTISATPGPMPGEKSRASANFSLEKKIPTQITKLYFSTPNNQYAADTSFAVLRKTFFGGTDEIFKDLKGSGTSTNIPGDKNDLYIGRVSYKTNQPFPAGTPNLTIQIDGTEDQ